MNILAVRNEPAHKIRMSREDKIYNIVGILVFLLITFICVYPFWYLMICTISDQNMVDLNQIVLLPHGINFRNYQEIFGVQNLSMLFTISVLRTVCTTVLSLVCTSYMAYFFTKRNMWGHKFWYRFTVITMYFSAGMIPEYLNNKMLGLNNSFGFMSFPQPSRSTTWCLSKQTSKPWDRSWRNLPIWTVRGI